MFGFKKRIIAKIEKIEERLDGQVTYLHKDNVYLVQLQIEIAVLKTANEELVAKVAELESNQQTLRGGIVDGLKGLVAKPTPLLNRDTVITNVVPPMDLPITDHVCGSIHRPPTLCTYCLDTHRYYGATCSCSTIGYPHSETCKDWPGPSGDRTISYEGLTQSD